MKKMMKDITIEELLNECDKHENDYECENECPFAKLCSQYVNRCFNIEHLEDEVEL